MSYVHRADAPNTTQWQDIFDKKAFGKTALDVYEEANTLRERVEDLARHQQIRKEAVRRFEEGSSTSDGDALSEEDEEFMAAYKQKLMDQLVHKHNKQGDQLGQKGALRRITAEEYTQETIGGSSVVLLHNKSVRESVRVMEMLRRLSEKYPHLKMLYIPAEEACKGYPSSLCPTLIMYLNGKLQHKLVGKEACGGCNCTMEDIRDLINPHIPLKDCTRYSDAKGFDSGEKQMVAKLRLDK